MQTGLQECDRLIVDVMQTDLLSLGADHTDRSRSTLGKGDRQKRRIAIISANSK